MFLYAKLITEASIDEITELNDGMRPADETLDDNTFFIYGGAHSNVSNDIITREEFKRDYRWHDLTSTNNIVVKK